MSSAIVFLCLLLIPCFLYTIINFTYNKYKDVENSKLLSGFEVARIMLDNNGLSDVYIVEIKGNLNDHYDYDQKVVRLTSDIFHGESVTAAIVASRIASYAIFDKEKNLFFKFRTVINKAMIYVNYFSFILFVLGICLTDIRMLNIANYALIFVLAFHFVTLPVEFDVNRQSMNNLLKTNVFKKNELERYSLFFKISACTFIMNVLMCVFNLINEMIYNLQRKG